MVWQYGSLLGPLAGTQATRKRLAGLHSLHHICAAGVPKPRVSLRTSSLVPRYRRSFPPGRSSLPTYAPWGRLGRRYVRRVPRPVCNSQGHGGRGVKAAVNNAYSRCTGAVWTLAQAWATKLKATISSWWFRALAVVALALGLCTAALNLWAVARINRQLLPQACHFATVAARRQVQAEGIRWVAPTGLLGLSPFAALANVELGPAAAEQSHALLPEVLISLSPIASLLQQRLVLNLHAPAAQVALAQCQNLSWFGYPDDVTPSMRDFLPGLRQAQGLEEPQELAVIPLLADPMPAPPKPSAKKRGTVNTAAPTPPDAAANFRPAIGEDLVAAAAQKLRGEQLQSSRPQPTGTHAQQREQEHAASRAAGSAAEQADSAPAAASRKRSKGQDGHPVAALSFSASPQADSASSSSAAVATPQTADIQDHAESADSHVAQSHSDSLAAATVNQAFLFESAPALLGSFSQPPVVSSEASAQQQAVPTQLQAASTPQRLPQLPAQRHPDAKAGRTAQHRQQQHAAVPVDEPANVRFGGYREGGLRERVGRRRTHRSTLQRPRKLHAAARPSAQKPTGRSHPHAALAEQLQQQQQHEAVAQLPSSVPLASSLSAGNTAAAAAPMAHTTQHGQTAAGTEQLPSALPEAAVWPQPTVQYTCSQNAALPAELPPAQEAAVEQLLFSFQEPPLPEASGAAAAAGSSRQQEPDEAKPFQRWMAKGRAKFSDATGRSPEEVWQLLRQARREAAEAGADDSSAHGPPWHDLPPGDESPSAAEPALLLDMLPGEGWHDPSHTHQQQPPTWPWQPQPSEASSSSHQPPAAAAARPISAPQQQPPAAVSRFTTSPVAKIKRYLTPNAAVSSPDGASSQWHWEESSDGKLKLAASAEKPEAATQSLPALVGEHMRSIYSTWKRAQEPLPASDGAPEPPQSKEEAGQSPREAAQQPAAAQPASRSPQKEQKAGESEASHADKTAANEAAGQQQQAEAGKPDGKGDPHQAARKTSAKLGRAESASAMPDEVRYRPAPAAAPKRPASSGVAKWLSQRAESALKRVKLPEAGIGTLSVKNGTLLATMAGEPIPRRFDNLSVKVHLSPDYRNMTVDLTGFAHERNAASNRCTMTTAEPIRHLRDAPSAPLVRSFNEAPVPRDESSPAHGDESSDAVQLPDSAQSMSGNEAEEQKLSFDLGLHPNDWQDELESHASGFSRDASELAARGRRRAASVSISGAQQTEPQRRFWERHKSDGVPASNSKPTGGRVKVRIDAKRLGDAYPDTTVVVAGRKLHAPLIERILELPFDIYDGRLNGSFKMHCYDAATWHLPSFSGRIHTSGGAFHIWDATDDFSEVAMDLLFEHDRLYMHNAKGFFGAVPMSMTGDMDLDPDTGSYRLSADVSRVDANDLRKTLGVKPPPYPVAGALRGVLHCTGPLEKPVFSGTAVAMRPDEGMLAAVEASQARDTLLAEASAAAAYDRVPLASGSCVFTMDTSSDILLLHSIQGEPLGGGQVMASGRLWVAPQAEQDPRAVKIAIEGRRLPFDSLACRYLPQGASLPSSLTLGEGRVEATMEGSQVAPVIRAKWHAQGAAAHGTADLKPEAMDVTAHAPTLDVQARLYMQPPDWAALRQATSQAEVSALAKQVIEGCDVDCSFRGLDVLPLLNAAASSEAASAPQRLRLNGRARFAGRLEASPDAAGVQAAEAAEEGDEEAAAEGASAPARPSVFKGELTLQGLRLNQLKLTRDLSGTLAASSQGLQLHAQGSRPDEALHVELALPLFAADSAAGIPLVLPGSQHHARGGNGSKKGEKAENTSQKAAGSDPPVKPLSLDKLLSPLAGFAGARGSQPAATPAAADATAAGGGAQLLLRCGQLTLSAQANASGSVVDCSVTSLLLDELELASLRGEVQEASLHLDLGARLGRGAWSIEGPRFSGLRGDSLAGAARWDRDVVRLERCQLQQQASRYEVQGEYVIPSSTTIPRSALSFAKAAAPQAGRPAQDEQAASSGSFEAGRWRVQVGVPQAELQELLPAGRLLSRAARVTPLQYEQAKAAFLEHVSHAGLAAQELGKQLEAASAQVAADATHLNLDLEAALSSPRQGQKDRREGSAAPGGAFPGLQDLRGRWAGTFQAYGGGGGAANVDFNVRGQDWMWGAYGLDQVVAVGGCHSEDGIKLEEVVAAAGDAKLIMRGSLLSARQDASLLLTDFPIALLDPLLRRSPALQHAQPAVGGSSSGNSANAFGLSVPFARMGLSESEGRAVGLHNSPVNGLLYVRGNVGGSAEKPEGELVVQLYEGAIGPTRLSQAQAKAAVDADQRLSFSVDLAPSQPRNAGFVRASGTIPLRPAAAAPAASTSTPSSPQSEAAGSRPDPDAAVPGPGPPEDTEAMEVDIRVKDAGMALMCSMSPAFRWQAGSADVSVSLRGSLRSPQLAGTAAISRGSLYCPYTKYPLTNVGALVKLADDALQVEYLDAKLGRRGHVNVHGSLPMSTQQPQTLAADSANPGSALSIEVVDLETRIRNVYTGRIDASLKLERSILQPVVSGDIALSRGVAVLAAPGANPEAAAAASAAASSAASGSSPKIDQELVAKAFTALTQKGGIAQQLPSLDILSQSGEGAQAAVAEAASLKNLRIHLGPELRSMYPFIVNLGLSGDIELRGPLDPSRMCISGTIALDSGEINLVATQLVVDREHANRVVFTPETGMDPAIDLALVGSQLRALVQGRASTWQQHLTLTPTAGPPGEAAEALDPAAAARIWEGQLAGVLLAEDGGLALSHLATTAAHGFMPKIQTQGQLGHAHWRLVSAPSIPGLLSLDPTGDPTALLASLTMGTEVEVQFGKSLTAAMARRVREAAGATQWTLTYQLNSKLRMQFNVSSASPHPRTLLFQYSSEASPT